MRTFFCLALFILITPLGAEAPPAPPPPPSFSQDEGLPEAPPLVGFSDASTDEAANTEGWTKSDLLKAEETDPQTLADQKLFDPERSTDEDEEDAPPAPDISDDQKIKNAMDVCYQLYHAEDFASCAKCAKVILDKYPRRKLFWVRYLRGLSYEHDNLYLEAVKDYSRVAKRAGRSTYGNAASFRLGLSYAKLNEPFDAIYVLRDIIDTHPRSEYRLQAYVHLGNLYRSEGEWKDVERIYKELIRLYPNTMWSYTGAQYLAEAYAHQGKFKKAIRIYKNMQRVQSTPSNFKAQAQLRIGDIYYSQEEWQKSVIAYRKALRDYEDVSGIPLYAEEKIQLAEQGRRLHRQPYEVRKNSVRIRNNSPADRDYRMRQIEEVYR